MLAQIEDASGGIALLDDLGGSNAYSEIVAQSGTYDGWLRLDDTSAVVTDYGLGAFLLVDLDLAQPGVIPLPVPGAVQSAVALERDQLPGRRAGEPGPGRLRGALLPALAGRGPACTPR